MAEHMTLTAQPRSRVGKGAARAVRREGLIPAVIYGGKQDPELVSVDTKTITKQLHTGALLSRVYMIDLDGKTTRVIPRDVQLDPVRDVPVHVDFLRLAAGAKVALMVPVHFLNQEASPGLKRGGVLNIVRHEVELIVDADNIPEFLEADLTGLDLNDGIHISAIALPEGSTPTITDRDFTVATIAVPSGFVEAGEGEGEEATEEEGEAEAAKEE